MKKALSYLFIFIGIQLLGGAAIPPIWYYATGSLDKTMGLLLTMSVITSIITMAVFLYWHWTEVSPRWLRTRPWMVLFWSVIAALGALIPSIWMQEQMPELPNLMQTEFGMMLSNRWGYLVIGLLAPFTEEMVFRGAILRKLLDSYSPWKAIALSAFFFSLIHMNPVQMPHAFLIGLLLGWMYWRTGSIFSILTTTPSSSMSSKALRHTSCWPSSSRCSYSSPPSISSMCGCDGQNKPIDYKI